MRELVPLVGHDRAVMGRMRVVLHCGLNRMFVQTLTQRVRCFVVDVVVVLAQD